MRNYTKLIRTITDAKGDKLDSNKIMKNQCQNLIEEQYNESQKLLHIFEELLDGTLGTWKMDQVDFELKDNAELIFSIAYPRLKLRGGERTEVMVHHRMLPRPRRRSDDRAGHHSLGRSAKRHRTSGGGGCQH